MALTFTLMVKDDFRYTCFEFNSKVKVLMSAEHGRQQIDKMMYWHMCSWRQAQRTVVMVTAPPSKKPRWRQSLRGICKRTLTNKAPQARWQTTLVCKEKTYVNTRRKLPRLGERKWREQCKNFTEIKKPDEEVKRPHKKDLILHYEIYKRYTVYLSLPPPQKNPFRSIILYFIKSYNNDIITYLFLTL